MSDIYKRYLKIGNDHQFIFGPRGAGKSTLLKQLQGKNSVYINLLELDKLRKFIAHPEQLRTLVPRNTKERITVIIDEVQKVPELTDEVHNLIEDKTVNAQFILTGSSARKLKKGNANMLAGRALRKTMHPFMAAELGKDFNLNKAIDFGTLPVVYIAKNSKEKLKAYIANYIEQEVRVEGLVRNLGAFERFLEIMSFCHGTTLNLSNIARESEISRSVVEGYVELLEDLLLGYRIYVFEKKPARELSSHPKFYFCDPGIYNILRPKGVLDDTGNLKGAALEGLIAEHLRAYLSYSGLDARLYFWRTSAGHEVDFVLYGERTFAGIEVKNSERFREKDLSSLKLFAADYPQANLYYLYRGTQKHYVENIHVVNVEDFLQNLTPQLAFMPLRPK